MIIDDRIVITGSYNFSENAESNDENTLILESGDVADATQLILNPCLNIPKARELHCLLNNI